MTDENTSLTIQIIETVASHSQTDPIALPRLYNSIDPDALEALMHDKKDSAEMAEITVTFTYADYDVTVTGDGSISVADDSVEAHENRTVGDV